MNNFPQDDNNLLNFLQANAPLPPGENPNLEENLMLQIKQNSTDNHRSYASLIWTVPSAIVTGLLVGWSTIELKPQPLLVNQREIESFLVNSWSNEMEYNAAEYLNASENYFLLPTNQSAQTLSLSSQ